MSAFQDFITFPRKFLSRNLARRGGCFARPGPRLLLLSVVFYVGVECYVEIDAKIENGLELIGGDEDPG